VLERVPNDKLTWRPHEKARTLGELALHVALVPGAVAEFVAKPSPAQAPQFVDPKPSSAAELVPTLDRGIANAHKMLAGLDDAALTSPWRMVDGDRELFTATRGALLRSLMLNHWYHHRGQLSTYLRTLGVAVPSIYGPTADENPFI
jgi:uncharacterized damage-inducible protein DinB